MMTQSNKFASLLTLVAISSLVCAQSNTLPTDLNYAFAASVSQTTITADNAVTLTPRPYTTINLEATAKADVISAYVSIGTAVSSSTEYRQNQPSIRFISTHNIYPSNINLVTVGGDAFIAEGNVGDAVHKLTLNTTTGSDNTVVFKTQNDVGNSETGVFPITVIPYGTTQQSLNGVTHIEAGVGYNLSDSMSIGASYTRDNLTIEYNENIVDNDGTISPTAKSMDRIASSFNLAGRFDTDIGNSLSVGARMNYGVNPSLERLGNIPDLDTYMTSFTVTVAYQPSN